MNYVIGLDVGTTGVRAILWDKLANRISESYESIEISLDNNVPGTAVSDPLEIFYSTVKVLKDAIKKAKIDPIAVATIGLATQRCSITIWDRKTGKNLIPLILWKDGRTAEETYSANNSFLPKVVRTFSGIVYTLTGLPKYLTGKHFQISTHNVGLKVKHILTRRPELRAGIERGDYLLGTLDSWLIWKLTNGSLHVTDLSNWSATAVYDPYDRCWSSIIGLIISPRPGEYYPTQSIFPKIKDTCDDFGTCDPKLLGAPIPITAVVGDQQAALFGHGCFSKGDTKVTLGTGGFLVQNTGTQCLASSHYIYPLVAWKIGKETVHMLEGTINSVGSAIQWAVDNKLTTFDEINNFPENHEDTDVYFVPALSGLSTPFHNASARGSFIGISHNTTRLDLVRSLLESIALRIEQILVALTQDTGISISQISIDGGVSQNDYILQSISNYTSLKTLRPKDIEKTSLGAAFLAGLHIGFWKDQKEIKTLLQNDRTFTSELSAHKRLARLMKFNMACERSKDWLRASNTRRGSGIFLYVIMSFLLGMIFCYVVFLYYF